MRSAILEGRHVSVSSQQATTAQVLHVHRETEKHVPQKGSATTDKCFEVQSQKDRLFTGKDKTIDNHARK
jgi:hypothetical protein